jgi:uncharacterized protein YdeI (YjbR/CyaY-like superfamily)
MKPRFFSRPAQFRAWLARHHATKQELLVGFHKKGSGKPSIARVGRLIAAGRMAPAGLAAFEARTPERTGVYSFERHAAAKLTPAEDTVFRANRKAAAFFAAQAPWYRRTVTHWVVSAKREETRKRRLALLIADCAHGRIIGPMRRPGASGVRKARRPTATGRRRAPAARPSR